MAEKKFKLTPSSYLILLKNNKILLSRRYNTGFQDGKYSLVAGHLNGGETFKQAIIREAKEEAGLKLALKNLEVVHILHRNEKFNDIGSRERVDIFIKANRWEGEPKNIEPEKCDDISWFPVNNLPSNTIPYIKHVIQNIMRHNFYSEFGFDK